MALPNATDPADLLDTDSILRALYSLFKGGTVSIGKVDHTTTGVAHGNKTVTTAGTPVALKASSTPCKWVWIHAYSANTGRIAVGGTGVNGSSTVGTGTGGSLGAGESIVLPASDLANWFIDATVNGEGVRFTYGT